jgi:two-component system LytT family response regulator
MLRVMVVDDEPLARQAMRHLLSAHPEIDIVAEAARAGTALELIRSLRPDAVFLDIQMPGLSGFDLLHDLATPIKVVFVTAHAEHAVRAFDFEAVDYLLKPVRPEKLARAVQRLTGASDTASGSKGAPLAREDRLCLRTTERTVVAPMESLAAIEADGDFMRVFLADEKPLLIGQTLASYERMLPKPPFLRLGRSLLVNVDRIARAEQASRDEMTLWLRGVPQPFALGRAASARLKSEWLNRVT